MDTISSEGSGNETEENPTTRLDIEENIKETIDNVSQSAHETVDKIAHVSYQTAEVLGEKGKQLKTAEQELVESYRTYIRENPIRSVGIAVAAGFILSRLL